jgi:hypothetical protein
MFDSIYAWNDYYLSQSLLNLTINLIPSTHDLCIIIIGGVGLSP